MTLAGLKTLLESIEAFENKVAYRFWPESQAPDLPFICYYSSGSDNIKADNKVYKKRNLVYVELCTEYKDETSEGLVEALFDANEIPWEKDEDYIDSENMYQITYSITI